MPNLRIDKALSVDAQAVEDQNGNATPLTLATDKVGIGTTVPAAKFHVSGEEEGIRVQGPATGDANQAYVSFVDSAGTRIGYVGDGSTGDVNVFLNSDLGDVVLHTQAGRVLTVTSTGNVGIGTTEPQEKLHVDGNILATGDVILPGADCAEDFEVEDTQTLEPGTVMVIGDEDRLHQSTSDYDRRVAGVLSGAGDCRPGIILGKGKSPNKRLPLALTGKVFCKVDARYSSIGAGDLLTTSPTPGHAMKATDPLGAFGAVIGKALRPLAEGQGLIPILIALH